MTPSSLTLTWFLASILLSLALARAPSEDFQCYKWVSLKCRAVLQVSVAECVVHVTFYKLLCRSVAPLKWQPKCYLYSNKFDSNNDASNECENERISLNLLEFTWIFLNLLEFTCFVVLRTLFPRYLRNAWRTDRRTHGPTDPRTDKGSYRDAWTHLKTDQSSEIEGFSLRFICPKAVDLDSERFCLL